MFKILKNIFSIITFIFFMILIVVFYFSEENIIATNKSRSSYAYELQFDLKNLPLIKNDTNNIIDYSEDLEIFKKDKKSYIFWDLIKK